VPLPDPWRTRPAQPSCRAASLSGLSSRSLPDPPKKQERGPARYRSSTCGRRAPASRACDAFFDAVHATTPSSGKECWIGDAARRASVFPLRTGSKDVVQAAGPASDPVVVGGAARPGRCGSGRREYDGFRRREVPTSGPRTPSDFLWLVRLLVKGRNVVMKLVLLHPSRFAPAFSRRPLGVSGKRAGDRLQVARRKAMGSSGAGWLLLSRTWASCWYAAWRSLRLGTEPRLGFPPAPTCLMSFAKEPPVFLVPPASGSCRRVACPNMAAIRSSVC